MRPEIRKKLGKKALKKVNELIQTLHALKDEIEEHKGDGRKRVLDSFDSDFYRAIDDKLIPDLCISKRTIECIEYYWARREK